MSLDKNLFTLIFTPHKDNPNVVDLVDPIGTSYYRKQRIPGNEYKIEVYDFLTESLLITATAPSATSKVKSLELHNPTSVVELKYTGTLSFKWAFKWEEHEFEWKREECFMVRKPDPPVIIAVTKEPTGRLKTSQIQILDYNLNRFDIDDRRGLEIVLLTALMTFHDSNETHHTPDPVASPAVSNPLSRVGSSMPSTSSNDSAPPPRPPPKPAPKTGMDRIAELQAMKGEYNQIVIFDEGNIQDYAEYCNKLLQDDAMLFISVLSAEAEQVPKVLQVVEETKRIRHKAGLEDEEELHQYVLYDVKEERKGPRRINLDDGPKNKYAPPKNLTVHLSKISMPELQPKAHPNDKPQKDSKKKDDKKAQPSSSKPSRPAPATPPGPSSNAPSGSVPTLKPPVNKLQRPAGRPSSPNPPRSQGQPTYSNHAAPSPSQLNNPGVYAAPPQKRPNANAQTKPRPSNSTNPPPPPVFPQAQLPTYLQSNPPSFPPNNWGGAAPPPPPAQQPQPPSSQNKPLSASNVVHGFLDLLNHRR